MKIEVKKLNKLAKLPTKTHKTDAGFDLYSTEKIRMVSGKIHAISTGIAFNIPKGYFGKIEERSGIALEYNLVVKAGVIDAGYTGEIKVVVENTGSAPVEISKGMKIAQLVIHKLPVVTLEEVNDFTDVASNRKEKGFGSSGK